MNEADVDSATRLDGNVAAGLLAEVFCCESTSATTVCSGCGAVAPMGTLLAYGLDMGAVLRCPHCDTAILRLGATGGARWVDLRGAVSIRFVLSS
jgi:hypothetical protein